MGTHPLTFSEVLEDEYRYFHGEVPYGKVEIEAKHIREIVDLDKRLGFHREANVKASRWKVFADAVSVEGDRAAAVVAGLNQLLVRPELLQELLQANE